MDDLLIQETKSTPEVDFTQSGKLCIKGRSLPENPKEFYNPLFYWIENLSTEHVDLSCKFEYVNTSSSKNILELIKSLDSNRNVKELNLNWYYEEDDFDILEFGEIVERSLKRTKVNLIECDDINS